MLLWGSFGYLLSCAPEGLARHAARRLGRWAIIAVAATVVTSICVLPVRTAMVAGSWQDSVDPGLLWAVVSATSVGKAWLADFAACLLLVGALFIRPSRRNLAVTVSSGLVLASLVMTGHAMMREGWVGYFQQANDLVHVLASGAWVGALVPLTLILREVSVEKFAHHCDVALKRFSLVGRAAVILILVTGVANSFLILGGWPADWASFYQVLLCLKIAIVLTMIGLASRNHFILGPRMKSDRSGGASAIRRAAFGEIALGTAAILLVAIFGTLDPGHGVW